MKFIAMAFIGGIAGFLLSAVSFLFFESPAMALSPVAEERFYMALLICGVVVGSCTGIVLALGSNSNSGHAYSILGATIVVVVLITLALLCMAEGFDSMAYFFAFPLIFGGAVLCRGINCSKRKD